jgi:hypothetical protein
MQNQLLKKADSKINNEAEFRAKAQVGLAPDATPSYL